MINRCTRCIMPEVEKHVAFDEHGVCTICNKHVQNQKKTGQTEAGGLNALQTTVDALKGSTDNSCDAIVALSGGKDSTMALYIAVRQLKLRPIAVFIDNGFCSEAMLHNVRKATEELGVDLLIYRPRLIKLLFKFLLLNKSNVYYCRICNALIDYYVRKVAQQHGTSLLISGHTKGQEFLKGTELFWIYRASDRNLLHTIEDRPEFRLVADMFASLSMFFHKHFYSVTAVSPFHYLDYSEHEILTVITEELGYALPGMSWPQGSTNCLFNFVSQMLAVKYFGYSQHEVEMSTLVRNNEMSRKRALEIIETPITEDQIDVALSTVDLTHRDIR